MQKLAAKVRPLREGSHEEAVLGLSWNREFRNVLASASADTTIKVWDVAVQKCEHTLTHHSGKVQARLLTPGCHTGLAAQELIVCPLQAICT